MNYSSQILNHLSKGEQAGHVLLVAGAPAVEKNGNLVKVLFNSLLTPDDIRDTLLTFLSHVRRSGAAELGATGMFSFGMAKMGRFRVHYLTQRGSIMVSIQRMPFDVPTLEQTLADPAQIAPAYQLVEQEGGGMIMITGGEPALPAEVAYALLERVNRVRNTVICVCEPNLSFSLRHHNSVVVQVELGIDVPTLEEALEISESLNPGILYVRNCKSRSEYAALVSIAESGTLVIISAVSHGEKELLFDLKARLQEDYPLLQSHLRAIVGVTLTEEGKMRLAFTSREAICSAGS